MHDFICHDYIENSVKCRKKKESRNSQFVTKLLNLLFLFSILGHDFSSYYLSSSQLRHHDNSSEMHAILSFQFDDVLQFGWQEVNQGTRNLIQKNVSYKQKWPALQTIIIFIIF